jgi:glyoxylase-like metal-dependent hydrolase (beta-lactamase superfamily II)
VPGVQALSTPGHTVGHTSFVISSQGRSIINIADLGHQPLLQMENPRAELGQWKRALPSDGILRASSVSSK